jgi:uncharacterized protein YjeT (DUF2065 family)
MSNRKRAAKKFWKSVFQLSLIYMLIIPGIFYLLDPNTFLKLARKDIFLFCLQMAGAAVGIALIISYWSRRDPELREW